MLVLKIKYFPPNQREFAMLHECVRLNMECLRRMHFILILDFLKGRQNVSGLTTLFGHCLAGKSSTLVVQRATSTWCFCTDGSRSIRGRHKSTTGRCIPSVVDVKE